MAHSILNGKSNVDSEGVVSMEHNIGYFKEINGALNSCLNEEGKVLRDAMLTSLKRRIENSQLNQTQNKYVQFRLQELLSHLDKTLPIKNRCGDLEKGICL